MIRNKLPGFYIQMRLQLLLRPLKWLFWPEEANEYFKNTYSLEAVTNCQCLFDVVT